MKRVCFSVGLAIVILTTGCAATSQRIWVENEDFIQTRVGPNKTKTLSTAQSILQCEKEWKDRTSRQPTVDTLVAYTGLVTNEKELSFFAGFVWMFRALFSPYDRADYIGLCMEATGFRVQCRITEEEAIFSGPPRCNCADQNLERELCPEYLDERKSTAPGPDRAGKAPR